MEYESFTGASIEGRLKQVKADIHQVALRSGRRGDDVELVLVTKTVEPERIREAWKAGARILGENRVQELNAKAPELSRDIQWHLIGHLQTNKAKHVVGKVALIQSLDRLELVKEIEKQAVKLGVGEVPCLVQVNASNEESKFGLDFEAVESFISSIAEDSVVRVKGLMTIGPFTEDKAAIREAFKKTKQLQESLKKKFPSRDWDILSMGMSGDFQIAIEEGSTMVRVGSLVFGARPKP